MGSSPSAPPDNSLQLQQERFQHDDMLRQQEQERQAAEEAAKRARFTSALDAAVAGARGSAATTLNQRGLDPNEFNPLINAEIDRIRTTIPDLAESPGTYFGPDLTDVILGREENARRTRYGNEVNSFFTPSYATNAFADTADDAILASILGEQRNSAQSAIERARARGTLNDQGYNAANQRLNSAAQAGNATLQTLGGTVISRNRQALGNIGDEARSSASSYTLGGSPFDLGTYRGRADSTLADLSSRFEGDVRGAAAGANLFDLGDIIGFGAREQGAQNDANNPLAEVLAQREQSRRANRGLGTQGSF